MNESSVALPGSERAVPAQSIDMGPFDVNTRLEATIVVRSPRAAARGELVRLSREAFAEQRAASLDDLLAVERFAVNFGLLVREASNVRRSVIVEGSVAQMNAAFRVDLRQAQLGDATYRMRSGAISIPVELDGVITGVFGLDQRPQAQTHFRIAYPRAVTSSFTPLQIAEAYGFPAGDGAGETIALIELGGGYRSADLQTYFTSLGVAMPTVIAVGVDGASNAPSGDANSADGEVELDIEVAGAIAPAATIVVYFAPNTDQGFLDAITTAIHDTTQKPTIISISWGGAESTWTQQALTNFDAAFTDAAMLGITVTCAAGDNGSSDGVTDGAAHVDFPASSPQVLACGGTTLHANGSAISSETVWNDSGNGATGGGISEVFPTPAWQVSANVPPSVNAGGHIGRGVPDVAGNADPQTGYQTHVDGRAIVVGGTSAVAPLWAGLIARLNGRASQSLGFINPTLYRHPSALRDIVQGSNGAYAARAGWDACTGLGTPNGPALETALEIPVRA